MHQSSRPDHRSGGHQPQGYPNWPNITIQCLCCLVTQQGRETIQLLTNFDIDLLKTHPNEDLAVEIERLGLLGAKTLCDVGDILDF